ncbi:MAG: hypothetical protein HY049_10475 [Acidobacteria bacterium]|nr:hypothetical protein [Acidobacteriota bacterium]
MPGSYIIDAPRGIVFSRGWGVLTDVEILAHARALRADPRFDPSLRQVADFRGLTEIRVTSRGVRLTAEINPFRTDARRAFIAPTDEAFGLLRMFSLYADASPAQVRIFRELGPALEWIGLDPADPWPSAPPDYVTGPA